MKISENYKIDAPAETIKHAVSTESGIQGWWCKNSQVGNSVGGTNTLDFVKEGNPVRMVFVIEALEETSVIWRCTENANPTWIDTRIIWSWDKDGNMSFTHDGFDDKYAGTPPVTNTEGGWKHFNNSLKIFCETGQGEPW